MSSVQNRKKVLIKRPGISDVPDEDLFEYQTEVINFDDLNDGEFLVKIRFISIDPTYKFWMTMDTYMPASPLGQRMNCSGVGRVVFSKSEKFAEGKWVSGLFGAQEYTVGNDSDPFVGLLDDAAVEGLGGAENVVPVVGLTAIPTAFVGMEVVTGDMDKEGKTLVISGASGNVGQWVVQLGKLHYNMKVIGIAGSDEKLEYLRELGCDGVINYKTQNVAQELATLCPEGVDVYFDNVGGPVTAQVFTQLNNFARVVFCGAISTYVSETNPNDAYVMIVTKRLRVQGFIVMDRPDLIGEATKIAIQLLQKGATYRTHPLDGLDNFIPALNALWSGENTGKVYLRLNEHTN